MTTRIRRAAVMLAMATAAVVIPVSSAAANVWYDYGWWYPGLSSCQNNGELVVANSGGYIYGWSCVPKSGGWELWVDG